MIISLLYHEDIIKAINYDKETDLNDDDWSYLKEIVKVLQRFYVITMEMLNWSVTIQYQMEMNLMISLRLL